ncbi:unnamed protein product [Vicia faba]|uniref:Uncharacterized protein n=1 Tax=Vicia faba TaxID=3906 RepID=A0AAV1B9D9_VICFA|nr:unnamed protein product [Vicia faba]
MATHILVLLLTILFSSTISRIGCTAQGFMGARWCYQISSFSDFMKDDVVMEEEVKKVCDFKKFDTNSRLQDLRPIRIPYHVPIATVLFGFALVLIAFVKGVPSSVLPSSVLAATAKSGFTAAFTLIFVSEIGDKGLSQSIYSIIVRVVKLEKNGIVGIQVPSNEMDELHDSANKLGLMYLKLRENAMQRKLAADTFGH